MLQLSQLLDSVGRLPRRSAIALLFLAITIGGLLYASFAVLNRPVLETLYSNLDAEDVNRIGSALSEVGISFDVNEAGTAVLVEPGKTAQARMILAGKGLPKSDKSGYELFDQMGSLGLTSFMQQVTRVRALEGELVRTIQQLEGIKSARVHLALKSEGAFRNRDEKPSASVVVRSTGMPNEETTNAIRQIVAAAIPGLTAEQVVVSRTDGRILSTVGQALDAEPSSMLAMEEKVASEVQDRIIKTLVPVAGVNNISVSVAAKLDLAKRLVKQKNFEPESKVERSTRILKSVDQSSNDGQSRQVSADQNIPREVGSSGTTDPSLNKKESKEELVNYEIASTETETVSNGYKIERLSVAVVINRNAFTPPGGTAPDENQIQSRKVEIEELVRSAAGVDSARNDTVKVSLIDFVVEKELTDTVEGGGVSDVLLGNLGTIINAIALLVSIVLVIMLGLRPALSLLVGNKDAAALPSEQQPFAIGSAMTDGMLPQSSDMQSALGEKSSEVVPIDKLNRMVGIDVDRAAQVLKRWLEQPLKDAA
jgi:flagellar M-ring protein FliF